jgi:hypothetical protein
MKIGTDILDHWSEVRSHLPADFDVEATARARGAFTRVREVRNADTLLRLALGYGACGMSLRETCAWAAAGGIATLSDPALIERLEKSADWLGDIVGALLGAPAKAPQAEVAAAGRWPGYRLRAIDATTICAPGADRTTWRLHVGYNLANERVDRIDLTDGRGAESLTRFAYQPGDIALADRGYARPRDLRPVLTAGAELIVRTGWNSLRLLKANGTPLDLFAVLTKQRKREGETPVLVDEGKETAGDALRLRLIIRRKTPAEAADARKRLIKEAKKRGKTPDPRSLEAARYILLLTSLPADTFPAGEVLGLYRLRWQIELAFKRMKSLAGLDTLQAKKPNLARAWIYARLIAILIAERIAGQVPDSSPCAPGPCAPGPCAPGPCAPGPRAPGNTGRKPIPMASDQDGPRKHPRRHSRTLPLEKALPRA